MRAPKQSLYTFGTTNINYYMITEPVYSELLGEVSETVIREGRVVAERPKIVTPYYLSHLEGFSGEARRYLEALIREHGAAVPGLFYSYKNEPKNLNIVSDRWQAVAEKLNAEIDKKNDPLASIIKGEDALWDVSLLKFIFEVTSKSLPTNVEQMQQRGLLNIDGGGLPFDARMRIEELFARVADGESEPAELKKELDRWGVFAEYEDRFFSLFGGRG